MKKMFSSVKWLTLFSGIMLVILGIIVLFTPFQSLSALAVLVGIAVMISGIAEIVSFCTEEKRERSGWMLASGIIAALLGLWILFGRGSSALLVIIPYIFAAGIMISSISRIIGSVSLKNEGFEQWGWVLTFGILGTIFGFILLFTPVLSSVIIIYAIAAMLISYGINNLIIFFRMKKLGDHIRKKLD